MIPSATVRAAQEALNNVTEHLDAIDTLAERRAGADAALAATQKENEAAKVTLRETEAEAERVSGLLASKSSLFDDDRIRRLAEINGQIKSGYEELVALGDQLKAKREAHDKVIAGMGSLVQGLDLGKGAP
jgi:hypothetical protein